MSLPSLRVMGITSADPALFASLMAEAGFRIIPRDTNPLNNYVQEESVDAIASAITESVYENVKMSPYHKKLKTLAEQAGYVVMIENCGPLGADPCEDDMMPMAEVGEGEAMMADEGGPEFQGEIEISGGVGEGGPMMMGGEDDMADTEVQQVASLPIGTELAAEILAVIRGEGPAALDSMGDEEMGPDMGGPEMGPEMDGPEMDGPEGPDMGPEEGPPEEGPPEDSEAPSEDMEEHQF